MCHSQAVFLWQLYEDYASDEDKKYYLENKEEVSKLIISQYTRIHPEQISSLQYYSKTFCPAHYICVDHTIGAIVISCRGTSTITDCIADCTFCYESLCVRGVYGLVHKGIYQTASTIYVKILPTLHTLTLEYPDYKILCTGHSLGGAVAQVLTILLRAKHQEFDTNCIVFGAVPSVSENIANMEEFQSSVVSIINGSDMIPRCSLKSISDILERIETVSSKVGSDLWYDLEDSLGQNFQQIVKEHIRDKKVEWNDVKETHNVGQPLLPLGKCVNILGEEWRVCQNKEFAKIEAKLSSLSDHACDGYEGQVLKKMKNVANRIYKVDRKAEFVNLHNKFDLYYLSHLTPI
ncbi:lipase containing protein, putative [Entamoeba invadens IP1]|uniref:lipase containing protein, putative n=1 Tax=Entamoeba invadens IP1 TaxID=370355 RepID=UPI0002C3F097|nr:lipase containing protein, putative [Entamoeba invadens IP1]ELP90665.1 lipase containing protein, putative [Entamoeba invadens IP1]|eukprot:XP_004257436.1 lipase containing protein, putative [Entamoeba invadens IP1]